MARITVEDCLKEVGSENRFSLIHLALARLKQHRNGLPYLVDGKNKEVVMTLREIASGKVTAENIRSLGEKAPQQAKAAAADEVEELTN
jgi:DNA-directed RNA polymerase subunit omega